MKLTKKQLIEAAKELNKILGLTPPISLTQKVEDLEKSIIEAAELIEPEDVFTKATTEVIKALAPDDDADATPDNDDDYDYGEDPDDDDDGDVDYSELELEELQQLCKDRGIKFKKKDDEETLIELLEEYDEITADADAEDDEDADAEDDEKDGQGAEPEPEKEGKKPAEKKTEKPEKKAVKAPTTTRIAVVAQVIKKEKELTMDEWIAKTDKEFGKPNPKESRAMINYATNALIAFGVLEKDGETFRVK